MTVTLNSVRRPMRGQGLPRPAGRMHHWLTTISPARVAAVAVGLAIAATLPWTLSTFLLGVAVLVMQAIPGALALNLLQGLAGQISAGNAGFLAFGALVVAYLEHTAPSVPAVADVLVAGLATAAIGAVVALPALRVRGLYLFVSTVALNFIVVYVLQVYQSHTVGDQGFILPNFSVFGRIIATPTGWYFVLLVFALLSLLAFLNLARTRLGRAWMAIRDRELSAGPLGVRVARYKIEAFAVSSFLIGIQGALFAYYTQVVTYSLFPFALAVTYIAMIIIGGQGSALGSILGAVFVIGVPYLVQSLANHLPSGLPGYPTIQAHIFDLENLLFGVLVIIFIIYSPGGLAALWARLTKAVRLWPLGSEERNVDGDQS
jgi:branched-chain amino acid transport system permease protein